MSEPALWRRVAAWRFVKFGLVGASGIPVNLIVLYLGQEWLLHGISTPSVRLNASLALAIFCATINNFIWNRVWTFRHERDASHMAMQGARFFAVSLLAAAAGFVLLETFVRLGIPKIPAEMLAVALVVPISFLGNKHWSFR